NIVDRRLCPCGHSSSARPSGIIPVRRLGENRRNRKVWLASPEPGAKRGDMSQNQNNPDWERLLQAQKETERQLREQKLQLDAALNNMLQGLCMFDAEEKIVLFNQRYAEMMNLPAGDLLGLSLHDLMRPRKAEPRPSTAPISRR